MLSNQIPHHSKGRHQRQSSTPTVFDTKRVNLLAAIEHSNDSHRRGLSLDQMLESRQTLEHTQQDNNMDNVEHVFGQQLSQQEMRDTQQQQLQQQARPGQEQTQLTDQYNENLRNIQPTPRPEHGNGTITNEQILALMTNWNDTPSHSLDDQWNNHSIQMFPEFASTTTAGYLDGFGTGHDGQPGNLQTNQQINSNEMPNGKPLKEGSKDSSGKGEAERPQTPPHQTRTDYFPLTPATTPFSSKAAVQRSSYSRTTESSPTRKDPYLMSKASHARQRGGSCQDFSTAMRQHAMSPETPSPPHRAPIKPRGSIDLAAFPQPDFFNMSNLKTDVPASNGGYNSLHCSPMTNAVSSTGSSFQSSPEIAYMSMFEDINMGVDGPLTASRLSNLPFSQSGVDLSNHASPSNGEQQPRSQSMSDFDLEDCIEDTGVTCDEIASFICGPDPEGKWKCIYVDCGKKFGRKENIKSHVQTHLGDRQFRCKHCNKCFVRQHDLKRHANTHTNAKMHDCPCGKRFARHDALTRHRQRGMCIGSFPGTPKKIIKRGRPKKSRPDTEERLEKAAVTRQRVLERMCPGSTYASSMSGSSESSHASPPELFDGMSVTASSPSISHRALQPSSTTDFLVYTPPTSPGYSTGHSFSPQLSRHSHTPKALSQSPSPKITSIPEEGPEYGLFNPGSRKSSTSHGGSPPELDPSSSSPAASKVPDFNSIATDSAPSMTLGDNAGFFQEDFFDQDFTLSDGLARDAPPSSIYGNFFDVTSGLTGYENPSSQQKQYEEALKSGNPLLSQHSVWNNEDFETDDPDSFFRTF